MWIRKGTPKRVHIQNGVHYFYWDFDLYKELDYEPIYVYEYPNGMLPISRYHWHILTLWTHPVMVDNKPIVDFSYGVHTPVVLSRKTDIFYVEFEEIDLVERIWMEYVHLPILKSMMKKGTLQNTGRKHGYKEKICDSGVPPDFVFDISSMRAAVITGELPEYDDLPQEIKQVWRKR